MQLTRIPSWIVQPPSAAPGDQSSLYDKKESVNIEYYAVFNAYTYQPVSTQAPSQFLPTTDT